MKPALKIGLIVGIIAIAIFLVYWFFFRNPGSALVAKLKANDAYQPFNGSNIDWNVFSGWVKANLCGMGGGDPPNGCSESKQYQLMLWFKNIGAHPTLPALNILKEEIQTAIGTENA
jgi:hypothetical protein